MDGLLLALQNDPIPSAAHEGASILKWLFQNDTTVVWVLALILGLVGWISKRLRDWQRQNPGASQAMRTWVAEARAAAEAAQSGAKAGVSSEATLRDSVAQAQAAARAAQTGQPIAAPAQPPPAAKRRQKHADPPPAPPAPVYAPTPPVREAAPSLTDEAPVPRLRILDVLGGPHSAATGIVLAEVLGPPVAFR